MKFSMVMVLCFLVMQSVLLGRIWTASNGKTVEAEFLKLDGEVVVLSMKGKEYRVPLSKLSQKDQDYARAQKPKATAVSAAAGQWTLFGTELKVGEAVVVTGDLSKKTMRALSGNKLPPKKMKIKVLLPEGFDPSQPQKVFWAVGGINNEKERLGGNIGTFDGRAKIVSPKGWLVVSADTEHGNPRESTVKECKGDTEFHRDVIEELTKVWPDFKSWKHACGGNSSGAKGSFFRVAHLLKSDATVVGGFFAGCNQSMAELASKETRLRKGKLRTVKAWQSVGDSDNLVSAKKAEEVNDEMKKSGYRKIRIETFKGGHTVKKEEFEKALDWFSTEEE